MTGEAVAGRSTHALEGPSPALSEEAMSIISAPAGGFVLLDGDLGCAIVANGGSASVRTFFVG